MKSGFDSFMAVFDAVTLDNLITKKDIAEKAGLSVVSVSKIVNALINAGLIISDGKVSTGGRRSEALAPDYFTKYAVINLCEKPFSYATAYLGERLSAKNGAASSVKYVPYLKDLDFAENVAAAANEIHSKCGKGTRVAIAIPPKHDLPGDYLGDNIAEIFTSRGLSLSVTVSKSHAVLFSPSVLSANAPSLYLSISQSVKGIYFGDSTVEMNWDGVMIDGLPYSEILKCSLKAEEIAAKTEKLIRSASDILCVKSVLLDTCELPGEAVDILLDKIDLLTDVTFSAPVLEGLLRLLAEYEIKKLAASPLHF